MEENNLESKAFEPDYLNRKALAVEWTEALLSTKLGQHLAISVSGDWGTGKTYIAKNWHKYLEENGYFTCYIDAHKKDYAKDPLLVFVEELNTNINQYYKTNMSWWWKIRSKIPILKNKVPKFLINSNVLIGGVELSVVVSAFRSLTMLLQKLLSSKLKDNIKYIALYEKYINDFKEALTKFTYLFDKPVVIFIDELDRSNPKFVIKLIEQLKHIFEIPNLAFILTVNKKELSNTIKGIYGSEMDGYAYYKKFTTHDYTLYPIEQIDEILIKVFIENTINKYNAYNLSSDPIGIASVISQRLNLSLRDIEQVLDHLYYIKEKVTQEYHKEYLIICFFYRAVYIKDYNMFINVRDILENYSMKLNQSSEDESIFTDLYNKIVDLCNKFTDINPFYGLLVNIINDVTDDEIKEMVYKYTKANDFSLEFPDIAEYSYLIEYTGIPMICKGINEYNRPVFYNNVEEVKQNILFIRKDLIQLSMLGAVPKNNIIK